MLELNYIPDESAPKPADAADLCAIFAADMNSLYLLAFLLTADSDKAEQCFTSALGECVEGPVPFADWAPSWARRTILKQAIAMMKPLPDQVDRLPLVNQREAFAHGEYNPAGVIVGLRTFERFVFVMSVLERHSDEDCAALLRCSRRDVTIAREVALGCLTAAGAFYEPVAASSRWQS